jgi:hypothetical protein
MRDTPDLDQPDQPTEPNPEQKLQRELYLAAAATLRTLLPKPCPDTPDERALCARVALAKVAALVPANLVEVDLAAYHVGAMARVAACYHQADRTDEPKRAAQLMAQGASLGREARGYIGKLFSAQAVRGKREATLAGADSAAMTEHCVYGSLTAAWAALPPEPERPAAPASAGTAAGGAAAPGAGAAGSGDVVTLVPRPKAPPPRDYSEWSDEEKRLDRLRAEADRWTIYNTLQARRIREHGGAPPDADFEIPRPELLAAILAGKGDLFRMCDTYVPWKPPTE